MSSTGAEVRWGAACLIFINNLSVSFDELYHISNRRSSLASTLISSKILVILLNSCDVPALAPIHFYQLIMTWSCSILPQQSAAERQGRNAYGAR
eukprot:m.83422 g.83422  ORF g.83422 m.83422 type:complete len:95 (+) comp16344_c0_seq5:100-384(+)